MNYKIKMSSSNYMELNYSFRVVKIDKIEKIEGKDFIHLVIINNRKIITSVNTKIGDTVLYFPVDSKIDNIFLRNNNLYRQSNNNIDKSIKGQFGNNGRVKVIKIGNVISEGFVFPINPDHYSFEYNTPYDSINNMPIIYKYYKQIIATNINTKFKTKIGKDASEYLIDTQFRFHESTPHLNDYLNEINYNKDFIEITQKVHGASGIAAFVLTKKKRNWLQKLFNMKATEIYNYVYSSGKPNSRLPKKIFGVNLPERSYFYKDKDAIWEHSFNFLKPYLTKGMSFYYEILGYNTLGEQIQNGYSYGCIPPENNEYIQGINYKVQVYKITYTYPNGTCVEYDIDTYNRYYGLPSVNILQKGFLYNLNITNSTELINYLDSHFMNKTLEEDLVPDEGIVIKINNKRYKYKNKDFILRESKIKESKRDVEDE